MTLIRLLAFIVVAWYAWRLVSRWLAQQERRKDNASQPRVSGRVVKCGYCDVHLPESDAVRQDDAWFCSRQHAQAWLAER